MVRRCYEFAGARIALQAPDDLMPRREGRLAPFAVEDGPGFQTFSLELVDAMPAPEGHLLMACPSCLVYEKDGIRYRYQGSVSGSWQRANLLVISRNDDHKILVLRSLIPDAVGMHTVLGAIGAESLVTRAGGVILHASCVLYNGRSIVFTAPSQTGKSTQAELWRSLRGATIVNGDRIALSMADGVPVACGIPYAGSSVYCENFTAPIGAIVYLDQAPCTSLRAMTGYRAFRAVWEGCGVNTWDREELDLATQLLSRILEHTPVFHLACTPDESAVAALEQALKGE